MLFRDVILTVRIPKRLSQLDVVLFDFGCCLRLYFVASELGFEDAFSIGLSMGYFGHFGLRLDESMFEKL